MKQRNYTKNNPYEISLKIESISLLINLNFESVILFDNFEHDKGSTTNDFRRVLKFCRISSKIDIKINLRVKGNSDSTDFI